MKSRTQSVAERLRSCFLIPETLASIISAFCLFLLYNHFSLLIPSRLLCKCTNIYHTHTHTYTQTHTHTHTQPWHGVPVAYRKRERDREVGGSSSRLTRADLIKLPVTLTNLLVLSHCVESSPPPSPDAPLPRLSLSSFPPPRPPPHPYPLEEEGGR